MGMAGYEEGGVGNGNGVLSGCLGNDDEGSGRGGFHEYWQDFSKNNK
jgi:hypothetical protein